MSRILSTLLVASAVLAAAPAAFASDAYPEGVPFPQLTPAVPAQVPRAQVQAELAAASRAGQLMQTDAVYPRQPQAEAQQPAVAQRVQGSAVLANSGLYAGA